MFVLYSQSGEATEGFQQEEQCDLTYILKKNIGIFFGAMGRLDFKHAMSNSEKGRTGSARLRRRV